MTMTEHAKFTKGANTGGGTGHNHGASNELSTSSTSTYKSMTSKMITPSLFHLPPADERKKRRIKETSAWTPGQVYVRDFSTNFKDSWEDPAIYSGSVDAEDKEIMKKREAWEESRRSQRKVALEKLSGLATLKYGNMANMLRTFKKNTGDTITLPEFAEHLRRRNLDVMLPLEDQELIWEQLKATARGSVDVGSLNKAVDETTAHEVSADTKDMLELRAFLAQQVQEQRIQHANEAPPEIPSGLADQDAALKTALGQKSFGLDVGAEEMENVVDHLFQKKHTKDSHAKFSRFLRMTNVKLHAIPFYDLRSDELGRLKLRASTIGEQQEDPQLTVTLKAMKDMRRENIEEDLRNSRLTQLDAQRTDQFKYSLTGQPGGAFSPVKAPRNLAYSASTGSIPSSSRSPMNDTGGGRITTGSGRFHAVAEETAGAGTRHGDMSMSIGEDRMHIEVDTMPETAAKAIFGSPDPSMYNSTYSEYYPPLRYEPNKPITREIVSDVDQKCKLRNQRRKFRQLRTEANTSITKNRLELDRLDTLNRQLNGERVRTEDLIRYQTTVFLHDLKQYKKQPLQTMSLKPNLTKSDAMWGGSLRYDGGGDSGETRDFVTTFQGGFPEHPPKAAPNIDIEARVRSMFAGGKAH